MGDVVVEDVRNVSLLLLPASPGIVSGELVKLRLIISILAEDTFIFLFSNHHAQTWYCAAIEPRLLVQDVIVLVYLNMNALSNFSFKERETFAAAAEVAASQKEEEDEKVRRQKRIGFRIVRQKC